MRAKNFLLKFDVIISFFLLMSLFILILFKLNIIGRSANSRPLIKDLYIQSIQYATKFWGSRFPKFKLKEVITDSLYETNFDRPTLLILFSGSDCRDCIKQELQMINNLNISDLDKKDINIIAVGITTSKLEILTIRKITQTNCTYLFDSKKEFEKIIDVHALPLIFIISPKNMILSAYYPIPGDRMLSELFFNGFINLLKGMAKGDNS